MRLDSIMDLYLLDKSTIEITEELIDIEFYTFAKNILLELEENIQNDLFSSYFGFLYATHKEFRFTATEKAELKLQIIKHNNTGSESHV